MIELLLSQNPPNLRQVEQPQGPTVKPKPTPRQRRRKADLIYFTLVAAMLVVVYFAATALAGDCSPFFGRHRAVRSVNYGHSGYSGHSYGHHKHNLVQELYFSAGPYVEGKAAFEYLKQTDPKYRKFLDFQDFLGKYEAFEEYEAAALKAPKASGQTIVAKCASCHSGDGAEKGAILDGATAIDPGLITKSLNRIRKDEMPPGGGLSDEDKAALMSELLSLEAKPEAKASE